MALPKINTPTYTLNLPSTGEKLNFRPFLVKEEKILLMVADSDEEAQVAALKQVLNACVLPNPLKPFDIDKIAMFDLDYIWLKIRSKSVDEEVKLPFECRAPLPDGTVRTDTEGNEYDYCGTVVNVAIKLDTIEVKKNPENNPLIKLQEDIGIKMRYPTFEIVQKLSKIKKENDIQSMFDIVMECTELLYEGEKTFEREHVSNEELQTFLESLSQPQFASIMKFFDTLPVLRHEVHFKCPKCKHEVDIVLEGTKSFLASDSPTTP